MVAEGMLRVYGIVVMAVSVLWNVREGYILLGLVAEACRLRKCRWRFPAWDNAGG